MFAPVESRKISTPSRKGSVLLCFNRRLTIVGEVWLSSAISDKHRFTSGSNAFAEREVNSPALRKPKDPTHAATHNMTLSGSGCSEIHTV